MAAGISFFLSILLGHSQSSLLLRRLQQDTYEFLVRSQNPTNKHEAVPLSSFTLIAQPSPFSLFSRTLRKLRRNKSFL
jgi:hypothetical protein